MGAVPWETGRGREARERQDGAEFSGAEYRSHGREFRFPLISPQATRRVNGKMSLHFAKKMLTGRKMREESGELRDGKLFGAGIGAKILRGERGANFFRLG